MKYLKSFNSEEHFDDELFNLPFPSVSLIEDDFNGDGDIDSEVRYEQNPAPDNTITFINNLDCDLIFQDADNNQFTVPSNKSSIFYSKKSWNESDTTPTKADGFINPLLSEIKLVNITGGDTYEDFVRFNITKCGKTRNGLYLPETYKGNDYGFYLNEKGAINNPVSIIQDWSSIKGSSLIWVLYNDVVFIEDITRLEITIIPKRDNSGNTETPPAGLRDLGVEIKRLILNNKTDYSVNFGYERCDGTMSLNPKSNNQLSIYSNNTSSINEASLIQEEYEYEMEGDEAPVMRMMSMARSVEEDEIETVEVEDSDVDNLDRLVNAGGEIRNWRLGDNSGRTKIPPVYKELDINWMVCNGYTTGLPLGEEINPNLTLPLKMRPAFHTDLPSRVVLVYAEEYPQNNYGYVTKSPEFLDFKSYDNGIGISSLDLKSKWENSGIEKDNGALFIGLYQPNPDNYYLDGSGTLELSYNGSMQDGFGGSSNLIWNVDKERIKKVIINEGITSISSDAFRDCINLTEIIIPNSVAYINDYAFFGCSNLSKITINRRIAPTIYTSAFGSDSSSYTGRNTYNQGINNLIVPDGAIAYAVIQMLQ